MKNNDDDYLKETIKVIDTGAIALYNNKIYKVGYYNHDYNGYCLYPINDIVKLDPIWVPKDKIKLQFS